MSTSPWWQRHPGLLEFEIEQLEQAGYRVTPDADIRRDERRIQLRLQGEVEGVDLDLLATYPDLYPDFRPEVVAPSLALTRHQHPFAKHLCLLASSTSHWRADDTLAGLLQTQLPSILAASRTPEAARTEELEEHQGEPFTHYYTYDGNSAILIDGAWELPHDVEGGEFTFAYNPEAVAIAPDGSRSPVVRAVVTAIFDGRGRPLVESDPRLAKRYPGRGRGRWIRLPEPPHLDDADAMLGQLRARDSALARAGGEPAKITTRSSGRGRTSWAIDVLLVTFPEETSWRTTGSGWLGIAHAAGSKRTAPLEPRLARVWRTGQDDLRSRNHRLSGLAEKTVTLIGLGALGAPLAIELARAGVKELRIVDHDHVDPATTVRWPGGVHDAGLPKAHLLQQRLNTDLPYTDVEPTVHRLGLPRGLHGPDDGTSEPDDELLGRLINGADLLIDATAELGVQQALARLSREATVPYLCLSATEGAWGGLVARITPDPDAGCYSCLMAHLDDGGAGGGIDPPPYDPTGRVEPAGCGTTTFSGSSFDLMPLIAEAARMATSTLLPGPASDRLAWDVATLALRDASGGPCPPTWTTARLERHPKCVSPEAHRSPGV